MPQSQIRPVSDAFLPPVEGDPFSFSCSQDDMTYTVSPGLAKELGIPEKGEGLFEKIAGSLIRQKDLGLLVHVKNTTGLDAPGGGFFRMRSARGIYWWSCSFHQDENGQYFGRMHCYDELYNLRMASAVVPRELHTVITHFMQEVKACPEARVWLTQEPVKGGYHLPGGISLVIQPSEEPSPAALAADIGLTQDIAALCRSLSDAFAIRSAGHSAHDLQYRTAVVFLYLAQVGRAFEEVQFEFQPIVDRSGRMAYVEMLARLRTDCITVHPQHIVGMLERGLGMIPFGRVTFERAVEAAARLKRAGLPVGVSYNYSTVQSLDPGLGEFVRTTIAREDVPAEALILEITESAVPVDQENQSRLFEHCRSLGMRIALDDMGTGFNSMTTLLSRHYDLVKFSGEITEQITGRPELRAFFRHQVEGLHCLGCRVCAEHVETQKDLSLLSGLGFDCIQGYVFSPAVPLDVLIQHVGSDGVLKKTSVPQVTEVTLSQAP